MKEEKAYEKYTENTYEHTCHYVWYDLIVYIPIIVVGVLEGPHAFSQPSKASLYLICNIQPSGFMNCVYASA
jgi:hypothetical protein